MRPWPVVGSVNCVLGSGDEPRTRPTSVTHSEGVGPVPSVDGGVPGASQVQRSDLRLGDGRWSVATLSLSFLAFRGRGDWGSFYKRAPAPYLSFTTCPPHGFDLQLSRSAGICCGRHRGPLASRTCLCPRCANPCLRASGLGSAWRPPRPPLLWAPRWGWRRMRTSLASGTKVSRAVSLVPVPVPCSPWV